MQRTFAKNIGFIVAVNLLIKPIWIFLIDRTVQNRVGYESYGIYSALLNFAVIFQIILDLGLNNYNTKLISESPEKLPELFSTLVTLRIFLALLYAIIVFGLGMIMGYRGHDLLLLSGTLTIQTLAIFHLYLRSCVGALQKFKWDGVLSVIDRFLMIIICGTLLFLPVFKVNFKIEWFILAQIFCYSVAILLGVIMVKKIAEIKLQFSFNFSDLKRVIFKGLPYALLAFLMATYTRSDIFLIERLLGESGKMEAGRYTAAFRLLDVSNMFPILFAGVLLPVFTKMLADKTKPTAILRFTTNLLLPLSIVVVIVSHYFALPIMKLLYPQTNTYNASLFSWVMLQFPCYCILYIYSTLLTANGNIALLNKIALFGVMINVGFNLYFIPQYGALGAAKVAVATQFVLALLFIYFAYSKVALSKDIKWIVSFLLFFILLLIMVKLLLLLALNWLIQLLLIGFITFLMMIGFRYINIKNFFKKEF